MSEFCNRSRQERTRDAWSCSRSRRDIVSAALSQKVSLSVCLPITFELHPLSAGGLVLFGRDHRVHRPVILLQEPLERQVIGHVGEPLGPRDARAWHVEVTLRPGL